MFPRKLKNAISITFVVQMRPNARFLEIYFERLMTAIHADFVTPAENVKKNAERLCIKIFNLLKDISLPTVLLNENNTKQS